MHEMGTVMHIIRVVEDIVVKNNLTQVASVTLEIGEVSGILPDYIRKCWGWAIRNTSYVQDAELKVDILPAITYCENCQGTYETVKYAKLCPYCNSNDTYLLTGNEYNIKEIEAV